MKRLGQNEHLITMLDIMASNTSIYIVMELVLGGELLYHLGRTWGLYMSLFDNGFNIKAVLRNERQVHRAPVPFSISATSCRSGPLSLTQRVSPRYQNRESTPDGRRPFEDC